MRTPIAFVFLALMASLLPPADVWASRPTVARSVRGESDFVRDYRISHYLELAVEFQAMAPRDRANRLRVMAKDPSRSSDVFPLCRMLFEANVGGVFRRPMLGGAAFLTGAYQDWPLEPITLFEGVPILIVQGYILAGKPESAAQYVAYCLANCRWSERRYAVATTARLRQTIDRFIDSNPALRAQADWLRLQAE